MPSGIIAGDKWNNSYGTKKKTQNILKPKPKDEYENELFRDNTFCERAWNDDGRGKGLIITCKYHENIS